MNFCDVVVVVVVVVLTLRPICGVTRLRRPIEVCNSLPLQGWAGDTSEFGVDQLSGRAVQVTSVGFSKV